MSLHSFKYKDFAKNSSPFSLIFRSLFPSSISPFFPHIPLKQTHSPSYLLTFYCIPTLFPSYLKAVFKKPSLFPSSISPFFPHIPLKQTHSPSYLLTFYCIPTLFPSYLKAVFKKLSPFPSYF